ncbi:AMP-binding protein [Larsenimonas suaedae]|uniref:Long-chain-fatty-acid--CoA ligase n=1 Tax=Larsenimonas suaedae TaxID=1851019 RepID=A0ABU1GZB0_9GAMM|nr:AMP-binding protein [Larsenimonas suaedae]MCM2972768.1 AMP-binding protein [Larsenimonas suaedae]MDR5896867.1 AMP-binding protein [Larsenimonas suaedae]
MTQQTTVLQGEPLEHFERYDSVLDVIDEACTTYRDRVAFSCMDQTMRFHELDERADRFAAWLTQKSGLVPGDRFAIILPNLLQYPVAVFGALRAGLVVVNTNPLYTPEEMAHQLKDSGAKGVLVFSHMADRLEKALPKTDVTCVMTTDVADLHDAPKRWVLNLGARHLKKLVPRYHLPNAVRFRTVMAFNGRATRHAPAKDDMAVLQYTGGTTGQPKGAMLTHANLIANMLQTGQILKSAIQRGQEVVIAPLPVYHIYTFTVNCMFCCWTGNHSVLIPNPRDMDGFIKTLKKTDFTIFIGLNTLFAGLLKQSGFQALDFSHLKLTISGGMALSKETAKRWKGLTGCDVLEGYGMTETSPVVCVNPPDNVQLGTIGVPVAGTSLQVVDEHDVAQPLGAPGELCVKGPQVMRGYWHNDAASEKAFLDGSWVRTGDMAELNENGTVRIVDRKKDMVIVSGFNVYPTEVEEVLMTHPSVSEAAVVGVPHEESGELLKAFVVASDQSLDQDTLRAWCKEHLTSYKVPRQIEFRTELPKSNVGKVLRRELRDEAA